MTAEEFFKEYVPEKEEFKIDFSNIIGLMEAYHKAEVEAITDEVKGYIERCRLNTYCEGNNNDLVDEAIEETLKLLKQ